MSRHPGRLGLAVTIAFAVVLGSSAPTASAQSDPNWWQDRSVAERQAILDHFYLASGHTAPYPSQSAIGEGSIAHLQELTPVAAKSTQGTQFATAGTAALLLPPRPTWVPLLTPVAGAFGALVGIQLAHNWSKSLYAHWRLDLTEYSDDIHVDRVQYYEPGRSIYWDARSQGEWLLEGQIDTTTFRPIRWFQDPCTFSGFTPPSGSEMRTGVPAGVDCEFPTETWPYSDTAPIEVDYPYIPEEDLYLSDYPVIGPTGTPPTDYNVSPLPTPDPEDVEPVIEELLEDPEHDGYRRRLLVAVVTERILENNPDDVTQGHLDDDRARKIADACVAQAIAIAGMASSDCGRPDLPIFVAGGQDYPEATAHVERGLEYHPQWWLLRYYQRPDIERFWKTTFPETDDPDGIPPCIGSPLEGTACDEFPFLKTEQGATADSAGVSHTTLPHLKLISAAENSGSGGKYGNFVLHCKMQLRRQSPDPQYGLGRFLVLPVPGVPTRGYCNGANPPG